MSEEIAIRNQSATMTLKQVTDRVNLVHQVLKTVMVRDTHFGTVPGCGSKMVLLKPGADVLAMTFRLVPQFSINRTELDNGHREFDVTCSMHGPDGVLLGQGVGSASTMEKKYRYRNGAENPDIADTYNTVLKIAKKRAHIDATLTVTGAADLFTQDLIDEDEPERKAPAAPTRKADAPQAPRPPAQDGADPFAADAGNLMVEGIIEVISAKPAPKGGKRYGIRIGEAWFNTFSDTVASIADAMKRKGETVRLAYRTNAKGYHDIVEHGIEAVVEAPPAGAPTSDELEQLF
jgi:hypothetical protein